MQNDNINKSVDENINKSAGKSINKVYIAIDLKSFYASVECQERKLDPMSTNLVVADESRTEKTICLAVSPSLKRYGIPGRARLFEVVQRVKEVNAERKSGAFNNQFIGSSYDANELEKDPSLQLSFIAAPPRMALYMEYSTRIYNIYLKYVAPEDIHVYSIDEVFMDVTQYLRSYNMTPYELTKTIIHDVFTATQITATAGIGSNLYLCKIAMDIVAKHVPADKDGVRIAELDEYSYRRQLWNHTPLTDFWRVGKGYAKKLEQIGIMTMGDVARCSVGKQDEYYNEELLYKMFGVNAELLIDHAWGWEPCTIADVKAYKPQHNSISNGQVLHCPYSQEKARLIVKEMTDSLALELVGKELVTNQIVLTIGYDIENLLKPEIKNSYRGPVTTDRYGRMVPKHAHGTVNTKDMTSSVRILMEAVLGLYDRITNKDLLIRRINITFSNVVSETIAAKEQKFTQMSLFDMYDETEEKYSIDSVKNRDKRMQQAMLNIKKKFGKNAILKGMNLEQGATARERNNQIGGHKA